MIMDALTPGDWQPMVLDDFSDLLAPIWMLPMSMTIADDERRRIGFRVEKKHCNEMMICHGGMMATIVDNALGVNASLMPGREGPSPTISLSLDYLQPARLGDWVESRTKVLRGTRSFCFVEGHLITANGIILRASGIFKHPPLN